MYLNESVLTCTLFFNKAYKCIKKKCIKEMPQKTVHWFFFNLYLSNNVKYKGFEVKTFSDAKSHYSTQ